MSIANELCSEVATAVLTRREDHRENQPDRQKVGAILMEFHATLRRLEAKERFGPSGVADAPPADAARKSASSSH